MIARALADGSICDVSESSISDPVFPHLTTSALLPAKLEALAGESALHHPYDHNLDVLMHIVPSLRVSRDRHDSSTLSRKRADLVAVLSGHVVLRQVRFFRDGISIVRQFVIKQEISVLVQEEKARESELGLAAEELTSKMVTGWDYNLYGDQGWILGCAFAQAQCLVYQIRPGADGVAEKRLVTTKPLSRNTLADRIKLLRVYLGYARRLLWVSDSKSPLRRNDLFRLHEKLGGNSVLITDQAVCKVLNHPLHQDVAEFYNETRHMQRVEHVRGGDIEAGTRTLTLIPVCSDFLPRNAEEYNAALLDVVRFLADIHHKWCHLDLRWPNIVYNRLADMWTVIDCEFLRRVGGEWTYGEEFFLEKQCDPLHGKTVGVHTDQYQLGVLISEAHDHVDPSLLLTCFTPEAVGRLQSDDLSVRQDAFDECVAHCVGNTEAE
jgi:hypothetical protein